MYIAKPLGN